MDGKSGLSQGVQIATLVGDPTKAGETVVQRIKFPPNFTMPPHTHPFGEVVTVIIGNIGTNSGEKPEKVGGLLQPGSMWVYPESTRTMPGPEMQKRFYKSSTLAPEASNTSTRLMIRAKSSWRGGFSVLLPVLNPLSGIQKMGGKSLGFHKGRAGWKPVLSQPCRREPHPVDLEPSVRSLYIRREGRSSRIP